MPPTDDEVVERYGRREEAPLAEQWVRAFANKDITLESLRPSLAKAPSRSCFKILEESAPQLVHMVLILSSASYL